jgi:hypothetical protein
MFINQNIYGTGRIILRFDKFRESIKRRIDINKDRMIRSDIGTSSPVVFITHLLQFISEDRVLKNDIFDVYINDILPAASMVNRKFDVTESGTKTAFNIFIKNSTNEYLIPTNGIIGTEITVLDDWEKWKSVQPIRMVANSSREIDILGYESQLTYKIDKPKYSVICIDSAALLLKYIIYLRHNELPLQNIYIDKFILEHVLSFLYDDYLDVWISNILSDIIDNKPIRFSKISNMLNESELDNAMFDVKELIYKYQEGALKLGDILSTKWYGNKSLFDMINVYKNNYSTYQSNRYIGPELIKMSCVLSIFVSLLDMTKDRQQETKSIRNIIIDLDILARKNWKAHVRSKKMIEDIYLLISKVERLKPVVI